METVLLIVIIFIQILIVILSLFKNNKRNLNQIELVFAKYREEQMQSLSTLKSEMLNEIRNSRKETSDTIQGTVKLLGDNIVTNQKTMSDSQDKRIDDMNNAINGKQEILQKSVSDRLTSIDKRFNAFTEQSNTSLEGIRTTVQNRLQGMQEDNAKQLDKMRMTVDEKLQKTLDERITQSFKLVNDRLQEVYTGLGEMKTLANGVGDLKKVLSNVKTRGILGELQLGAILEEVLSKEQYEENIVTKPSSSNRVEFAIKLPGDDGKHVYLPIDAKFPADTYNNLLDAYDTADNEKISKAYSELEARIKGCAKDIHDKYIDPPHTTEFAIMFLPFEGLYAEVVRRGLVEKLQSQYKVNIAGPTTIAALLNSLQMGFKTLAIQKRSSEVWSVLGAVKTEFGKFEDVLGTVQKRIEQTSKELDTLVGVRTRQINRQLGKVQELPEKDSENLIDQVVENID